MILFCVKSVPNSQLQLMVVEEWIQSCLFKWSKTGS